MKIVTDSSANLDHLAHTDFAAVPIRIRIGDREYRDTPELDADAMMRDMTACTESTGTACPSVGDWLRAFGEDDSIVAAVLTSKLSGCYNGAAAAAEEYMDAHPGRRVVLLDTLTTGPAMELIAEKGDELHQTGMPFDELCGALRAYVRRTRLAFMLGSLNNFARNGRVSPALAKLVSMLKIRIVGRASDDGDLEPLNKCRGEKNAVEQIWSNMRRAGYNGGKVRIRHTDNRRAAEALRQLIAEKHPLSDVRIAVNRGLCSYYAERGGLLVGFEGGAS